MIPNTGPSHFHVFRHVLATFAMILIAACGTDTGFAERSPEATDAPPDKPITSSTTMPKDLRAAYIASVQRDAPKRMRRKLRITLYEWKMPRKNLSRR